MIRRFFLVSSPGRSNLTMNYEQAKVYSYYCSNYCFPSEDGQL